MPMRKQHKLFVEEYLIDLNATQAAIRAGYSPKTAQEQGSRLLSNVMVSNAIARAMADRSKRTGINQDRVLRELARIAFVNPTNVINMDDATINETATDDDVAAILSVKVKTFPTQNGLGVEREIKMNDKLKALELLGKHLGMLSDRIKIGTADDNNEIKITVVKADVGSQETG